MCIKPKGLIKFLLSKVAWERHLAYMPAPVDIFVLPLKKKMDYDYELKMNYTFVSGKTNDCTICMNSLIESS